jgi:membrane protein implicated in regulation of membrane protease activity
MADNSTVPAGPTGAPATPPRILPWLFIYTVGRLAIAAALVLILWMVGLDFWAGLLFGLLLSMPVSYLLLRPSRERLSEALAARSLARRTAKEDLRTRLSGTE